MDKGEEAALEGLPSKASKEELKALILAQAESDKGFHAETLSVLGAPPEQELTAAKELVKASIRRNTRRGSIDMWGCDDICREMDGVLEKARRRMERRQYAQAIALSQYILSTGVKLASEADSSSGSLSYTVDAALEIIRESARMLSGSGSTAAERRRVFDGILKAAKSKVFDGWEDWRYALLRCAARVTDKKSAAKLYALLDALLADQAADQYGRDYITAEDMETRFCLIKSLDGKETARAYLEAHLDVNALRELAVHEDMDVGNYANAERLCLEKVETEPYSPYSHPSRWHELLYSIYRDAGQWDKLISQLWRMVLLGNMDRYDELKGRLKANGVWGEEYPRLREEIRGALPRYEYMRILEKESELELLMEQVQGQPETVFEYGKQLSKRYAPEVCGLCVPIIRGEAARARDRNAYKKLCGRLNALAGFGGSAEARRLIIELRETYPNRPALLDELAGSERSLTRKGKRNANKSL